MNSLQLSLISKVMLAALPLFVTSEAFAQQFTLETLPANFYATDINNQSQVCGGQLATTSEGDIYFASIVEADKQVSTLNNDANSILAALTDSGTQAGGFEGPDAEIATFTRQSDGSWQSAPLRSLVGAAPYQGSGFADYGVAQIVAMNNTMVAVNADYGPVIGAVVDRMTGQSHFPGYSGNPRSACRNSRIADMNSAGQVTGFTDACSGGEGYIWSLSAGRKILAKPTGALTVYPVAINNLGDIVGYANFGSAFPTQVLLWHAATADQSAEILGGLSDGSPVFPVDINDQGVILGRTNHSVVGGTQFSAVIRVNAQRGFEPLFGLVNANAVLDFIYPVAINNANKILLSTIDANSERHRAILNPRGVDGDMNCDGVLNNFDSDPFTLALVDQAAYMRANPNCNILNGDVDHDNVLTNFDIDPYVQRLLGGPSPLMAPEPQASPKLENASSTRTASEPAKSSALNKRRK